MLTAIIKGREQFFVKDDSENYVRKQQVTAKVVSDYEASIKHPLFPDNAYLTLLPSFELFANSPLCELHALTTGFFDHIVKASIHLYSSVLRSPELVRDDGKPLINDARLGAFSNRLQDRLRSMISDECMLNVSPSLIDNWRQVFLVPDSGARMPGDHYKLIMLLQGYLYNDLIHPEVSASFNLCEKLFFRLFFVFFRIVSNNFRIISNTKLFVSYIYFLIPVNSQVQFINQKIDEAQSGSRLHGLRHIRDPSDDVQTVHIAWMEFYMFSRRQRLNEDEIGRAHV